MNISAFHSKLKPIYDAMAKQYGETPEGLGWVSRFSQEQRFWVLSQLTEWTGQSVLDVGCGHADFLTFMNNQGWPITYTGIDFSHEMIKIARKKFPTQPFICADVLAPDFSFQADYVIASGPFNYKVDDPEYYIKEILARLFKLCKRGMGLSLLSSFAPEAEKYQDSFCYYSPLDVVKWAFELTPHVNLFHAYLPHDFTVMLYHPESV